MLVTLDVVVTIMTQQEIEFCRQKSRGANNSACNMIDWPVKVALWPPVQAYLLDREKKKEQEAWNSHHFSILALYLILFSFAYHIFHTTTHSLSVASKHSKKHSLVTNQHNT